MITLVSLLPLSISPRCILSSWWLALPLMSYHTSPHTPWAFASWGTCKSVQIYMYNVSFFSTKASCANHYNHRENVQQLSYNLGFGAVMSWKFQSSHNFDSASVEVICWKLFFSKSRVLSRNWPGWNLLKSNERLVLDTPFQKNLSGVRKITT